MRSRPVADHGWRRMALATMFAWACADAGDVLYQPPGAPLIEVEPGIYQVTFGTGAEYARGFTIHDDTVLYRAERSGALGPSWRILGAPIDGGAEVEQAGLYRQVLNLPVATLLSREQDRILAVWRPSNDQEGYGPASCGEPCHLLVAWSVAFRRLGQRDGSTLSSSPVWITRTPTSDTTQDTFDSLRFTVRVTPAQSEAEAGSNPFGPVATATGDAMYYSDGETVWRVDLANPALPPEAVSRGAFPALSSDGTLLASAIPLGLDSTLNTCVIGGLRTCFEDTYTITADSGWVSTVLRVASGDTVATVPGLEPVFSSDSKRVLVRRDAGLTWIDLVSGEAVVVAGTAGAFAASVSHDGAWILFSKTTGGNTNVYLARNP